METPQNPVPESSDTNEPEVTGTVVMAQQEVSQEAQNPSSAEGFPQAASADVPVETIVVPTEPAGNAPKGKLNSFSTSPGDVATAPTSGGSKVGKWIFRLLLLAVVVLLLVAGGKFVLGRMNKNKEVTITYWGMWESDATVRAVIREFEQTHPNIKVQHVRQQPRQYRERLQAALGRQGGPDVFRFHNTWVPMFAQSIDPVPDNVMSAAEFTSSFYPVASSDLIAGSAIYGIPIMIDGLGLYYNEDLFATAGVAPPLTWNDVLDLVPKLTVKNANQIVTSAIALGTTGNVEHFSDIVATMIMQNGATLTDLTSQKAQEAVIFYRKFADPTDPTYTWSETMDNSVSAFANGRVAMMIAPSWRAFEVVQINPDIRFKIVPIPQLPGNTVTWASYWVEGVSNQSPNKEQAWEFVKYITSSQAATALFTEASKTRLFGEPYALVELGSSIADDPLVGAYIRQAKTAKSFPLASRTFDNGINDKLIKYLEDSINAIAAGTAPSAALSTAQSGFEQVLSTYGITVRSSAQP